MKRIFSVLSLMIVLALTAHAQMSSMPQHQAEKLSKQQLKSLIAEAKTPEEHHRISQYYDQKSQEYLEQAKEHEGMVVAYKANLSQTSSKSRIAVQGQISHCEYFVKTFREMAAKSSELARAHEQMAKDAEGVSPASGK